LRWQRGRNCDAIPPMEFGLDVHDLDEWDVIDHMVGGGILTCQVHEFLQAQRAGAIHVQRLK